MSDVEHKHLSQKEAARQLDMFAGGHEACEIETLIVQDEKLKLGSVYSCEALIKVIWEIISNALDQYILGLANPDRLAVRVIEITFKDGIISVYNDGHGIPVEERKTHDGRPMYLVQMLYSEFHAGSNFNKKSSIAATTGGMNGLGAKLTGIWSTWLKVETQDEARGLLYEQTFRDSLENIEKPVIRKKKSKRGWTRITFQPDYARFKLTDLAKVYDMLDTVLRTTSYLASAFVGKKVQFHYNDTIVPISSSDDLAKMLGDFPTVPFSVTLPVDPDKPEDDKTYTWTGSIVIHGGEKIPDVSVINGIYSPDGGDHVKWVKTQIWEEFKERATKKLSKLSSANVRNSVVNQFSVVVCGLIVNPRFRSQRKDYMTVKPTIMKKWEISPQSIYSKIWKPIEDNIMATYYQNATTNAESATRMKSSIGNIDGYEDCTYAGTKHSSEAILVVCEGKSAITAFTRVKQSPKVPQLNHKNCAIYSLGGVIVNVRKNSVAITDPKTGTVKYVPGPKLTDDKSWFQTFLKITSLNTKIDYKSKKDRDTLRFGKIIILSDEDIDGTGKIAPLVLNLGATLWPELAKDGYISRFETPIMRAYYPKKPKNGLSYIPFYTVADAKAWEEKEPDASKYRIRYYKGLGGHTPGEIIEAFEDYAKHLYSIPADPKAEERLELFFGKETSVRKIELGSPKIDPLPAVVDGAIPMSSYLNTFVKEFQKDTLFRALPDFRDGYTRTRRKIIHGVMKKFRGNGNRDMKVFQAGGYIASEMGFHHGDASLYNTIICLAKPYYSGGPLYPMIIGLGQFGSEMISGDNASPRYINMKANLELLNATYPPEDECLLPDNYVDGDRVEKQYFLPIVPPIIESYDTIATGWSVNTIPLEFKSVVENVKLAIEGKKLKKMSRETWGYEKCRFFAGSGRQSICVAGYEQKGNEVVITQLPPGMYTRPFKEKCEKLPAVVGYEDVSKGPFNIEIRIKLDPNWESLIANVKAKPKMSQLETYLGIHNSCGGQVNFIDSVTGRVLENMKYEDLFMLWFAERKQQYEMRVAREIIQLEAKILLDKERLRYIKSGHDAHGISMGDYYKYLEANKYATLDTAMINSPRPEVPNDILAKRMREGDYKYITRLNGENRTDEGQNIYKKSIEKSEERLAYLQTPGQKFVGERVWCDDLDRLTKLVGEFRKIRWVFEP